MNNNRVHIINLRVKKYENETENTSGIKASNTIHKTSKK